MKLEGARITLLINREYTEISITDENSGIRFLDVKLTPEKTIAALSRQAYVECECELHGLEKLGKKQENRSFEFEITEGCKDATYLSEQCERALLRAGMQKWESDNYYGSQNSFFTKDGKSFARVIIRRWI